MGRNIPGRSHARRPLAGAQAASGPVSPRHIRRAVYGGERGGSVIYLLVAILIISATVFVYYTKQARERQGQGQATSEPVPGPREPSDVIGQAQEIKIAVKSETGDPLDAEIVQATDAANAGEYGRAERQLRDLMRLHPGSARAAEALATVLNNAATQLSNKGRHTEARDYLKEAWKISDNVIIARNLAQEQIKLNDMAGAAHTLEQVEGDPAARQTLAWVYYQLAGAALDENRKDEALKYYELLAALQPDDVKLRDFIAGLKAETTADNGMGSADGANFIVRYEGGENAVTGHVIGLLLEEAYHKVGSDLNFYPEDRIEAVLYMRENFHDVTGSPSWAGALYDGRIKVPAGGVTDRSELLEKVLFHEYTHAVVHRLSGARAPVWLNEGLAQIEEGKDDSAEKEALKQFAIAARDKKGGSNVLRRLEGSFMGLSADKAAWAYLLSLSSTRYMTREFGVFSARSVLENLRDGKGMDEALNNALSISYDNFCDAWLTSLSNG